MGKLRSALHDELAHGAHALNALLPANVADMPLGHGTPAHPR